MDAIIQDARTGDGNTLAKLVQRHYYALCARTDWQAMRNKTALTFAASAAGVILPSDLVGILAVIDSDGNPYHPTARAEAVNHGYRRSWMYVETPTTPLDVIVPDGNPGTGLTVGENQATFSVAALGGDRTGEYIRFSAEPGFYKLTGAAAFTPTYRGANLSNQPAVVRPASTRFIKITDEYGDLASGTVNVYYWAYPEPLYQEWQEVMLPATRALELMCIIDIVGGQERMRAQADAFRMELESPSTGIGAWADMLALNPKFVSPAVPRDYLGQKMMFGRRR
jgi:hypothetical protein